tara:strand:- start:49 stop:1290 length:1242 start_codon:yes stop_codon:yes gene_type:complete
MEDLEVIVERFRKKYDRRRNLEAIYEQIMPYFFIPHDTVDALDVMIQKLIAGKLEKRIVVVRANSTANLKASSRAKTKRGYIEYSLAHLFSRYFYLGSTNSRNKRVRFVIDPFNTITFDDLFNKGMQTFQLGEGEYFDCVKIPRELYEHSSGVAIMKTTKNRGSFAIGTIRYDFGQDFTGKYVFVFFENGEPLFFDSRGNMVFTTLSNVEVFEQKRLERILPIQEAYDSYVDDDQVEDFVTDLWSKAPEKYFAHPETLLVRAKAERPIISNGNIKFYHYNQNKRYKKTYTSFREMGNISRVSIRGRNLLIHSSEGELLNALSLSTPGALVKQIRRTDVEEAVGIRSLRDGGKAVITLSNIIYSFSKFQVDELSADADYRALMVHVHPQGNTYYLCLKKGNDVSRHPLECISIC